MRRAQILGQVFILILASVIFILILLYGYRAIGQFSQRSYQVAMVDFENNFRNAVKAISLDYGSVKRLDLSIPSKHRQLCILCTKTLPCGPDSNFQSRYPLIYDGWTGGTENVFLLPKQDSPILIDRVEAENGAFCMDIAGGRASLRLEGLGDKVKVSPWQQAAP